MPFMPNMQNFRNVAIFALSLVLFGVDGVFSFQVADGRSSPVRIRRPVTLFAESSSSENMERKDHHDGQDFMLENENNLKNGISDDEISHSLSKKIKELKLGIGKRYIIRTQQGFLNVHYEPTDPYMTENVVDQLSEGQIVTATGPTRGIWIPHDGGGWSVSKYGGFTWLEPIDE